ncbi:hypothetical protein [Microbacterium sp. 22242]|uniref:hypothetical protein n=1 Tax=Microbacterium sp. 22242 TaxID=3453896 RepID=UPI003F863541
MTRIEEHWSTFPYDKAPRVIRRDEEGILTKPELRFKPILDHQRIQVIHFPATFEPTEFAIPRPVYESHYLRIEWQTMPGSRQPFYHRNTDVDELSFQVDGTRSLITELGLATLRPGDYTRLPVGITHDNYSPDDIHVLFYFPAPVTELIGSHRQSEIVIPPQSWEASNRPELVTECLGGPEHDITLSELHEDNIWNRVHETDERLEILRVDEDAQGTTWLYGSDELLIGQSDLRDDKGLVYLRNHNAEEMQYQISGERLLVTQRGMVRLVPGDFVRIPLGVAYTNIVKGASKHIRVCSAKTSLQVVDGVECVRAAVPQIAESTGEAVPVDFEALAAARAEIG